MICFFFESIVNVVFTFNVSWFSDAISYFNLNSGVVDSELTTEFGSITKYFLRIIWADNVSTHAGLSYGQWPDVQVMNFLHFGKGFQSL